MASYTSRLILVLAVPSIVGILSILFFNRKRKLNYLKNSETDNTLPLSNLDYIETMKLKHNHSCCNDDSEKMQIKEVESSNLCSNKIGSMSYANCLKQIRTGDVLITANGVQDVEDSSFQEVSVSAIHRVELTNGKNSQIHLKNSIKHADSKIMEKRISGFSYYDTGARPKVKMNDSSEQNGKKKASVYQNFSSVKAKTEKSNDTMRQTLSFSPSEMNSEKSNSLHKNKTNSNGVSHYMISKHKSNSYENNNSCPVSTISKCLADKSKNDSMHELSNCFNAIQVSDNATLPEVATQASQSKITDIIDKVQSECSGQVRTDSNIENDSTRLVTKDSFPTSDFIIKDASNVVNETDFDLTHSETPESGRSSSSSEVGENPKVDEKYIFSEDIMTSNLQAKSIIENPESAYCESVESNDSGKGGSEILFGSDNQSTSMLYEFDFPSAYCGVLIGRKGSFINQLKYKSNTSVFIRNFPFDRTKKVVTISGEENEINTALALIRGKFPLCKYPEVTLERLSVDSAQIVCPPSLKLALPEGVEFQVVLSATVNACNFFVQLPTHPSYHALQPFTMSMTSMYTHCDTPSITNPSIGNIVAAPVGEGWFRAEILEVYEDNTCKLKYLDYGGYQVVPATELRKINIEYMQMPFQATECYLANVTSYGEIGWTVEAKAFFEELAQGQILSAYVAGIAENGIPCLYLYQVNGATNTFINQALVEAGYLKWIAFEKEDSS